MPPVSLHNKKQSTVPNKSLFCLSNFFAFVFIYVQSKFKIISLDKDSYYLDFVPIKFEILKIILINVSLSMIILVSIYLPIYFIGKISVNDNVKFN